MERRFGRYVVTQTLGTGAMGEVFRARDERLGREVALKTVRNVFGIHTELFRSRFDAEARALAALSHPAIVQIHDLGIEGDEPYLVMELVDGPSLKGRLERGPMPAAEVRALGIQVARALEAAHRRTILHRDLKPANILRSSTGQWKLADFGVAQLPESELTITGQFLGSPAYAAPESLTHGQFSEHSDVYGLAMTLVEAATGKKLHGNATMSELVQRSGQDLVLPPELEPTLARALRQALARDPAQRPTASRFAEILAEGDAPTPAPAPAPAPAPRARAGLPVGVIAAIAGAVVVLAGIVVAVVTSSGDGDGDRDARSAARGVASSDAGRTAVAAADARPAPDATPAVDAAALHPLDMPPIVPGRITIKYPPRLDPDRYQAYAEIVDEVRANEFDRALQYLDHYEEVFESTIESQHLRAQIEALPSRRRRPD